MSPQTETSRERGAALVLALLALAAALTLLVTLGGLTSTTVKRAATQRDSRQLAAAARLAGRQAKLVVWDAWVAEGGGQPGTLSELRAHLDGLGLGDGQRVYLDAAGSGLSEAPARTSLTPAQGQAELSLSAEVTRADDAEGTSLRIVASARLGDGTQRTSEAAFRVGARQWEGLRYALLGDHLGLALEGTRVSSVERFYGIGDPATHERVKVGSNQRLRLPAGLDSLLAGTLYTRGQVLDALGAATSPPGGSGGIQSLGINLDGTLDGAVREDLADGMSGALTFANYYESYPSDESSMFDGVFPTTLPEPVPSGADQSVDDGEWLSGTTSMFGNLNGLVVLPLPSGTIFTDIVLPSVAGFGSLASGTNNRNVIMIGDDLIPLRIDGDVAVDGDVVITGKVQGTGRIVARGNIYIIGDLTYADGVDGAGNRTFGVAPDGTTNALGLVAGGNVIHGAHSLDYDASLIPFLPLPAPINDLRFEGEVPETMGAWNRDEWAKTQPFYDPVTQTLTTTDTGVANVAYAGASYQPSYYTLRESSTPRMSLSASHTWDNAAGGWLGPARGPATTTIAGTPGVDYRASNVDPTGGWIPSLVYGLLNQTNDLTRALLGGGSRPYQVDGLLYARDAVMINSHASSGGRGSVVVNGAIVGRHVGVHASGGNDLDGDGSDEGLALNYDARLRNLLAMEDSVSGRVQLYSLYTRER